MAASVRMDRPWLRLTDENVARVGGYMGVYELADAEETIVRIGYAGGRSLHGLGGELQAAVGSASVFRYEVTQAYTSRYLELLMVHMHDYGRLPPRNDDDPTRLGRMSPA